MRRLKRQRYWTMNSWNGLSSIAYNLKIYKVIDRDLQDRVYSMLSLPEFYEEINMLIHDFDYENKPYSAGFNGRSGGYLVLYKDGINHLEDKDIPANIKKAFRRLAIDIVKATEYIAKNYTVQEQEIQVTQKIKVLVPNN